MTSGSMAVQWFVVWLAVAICRFGLSLKLHASFHQFGAYHTIQRVLRQVAVGAEESPLHERVKGAQLGV